MGQLKSYSVSIRRPSDYTEELFSFSNGSGHGCYGYREESTSFSISNYSLVRKVTLFIRRDDYANITLNGYSIMNEVDKTRCRSNSGGPYEFEYDVTNKVKASGNSLSYVLERFNQSSFIARITVEY